MKNIKCDPANAEIAKKFRTIASLIESGHIKLSNRTEVEMNLSFHLAPSKFFGTVGAAATFLKGEAANSSCYRSHTTWGNTALVKTDGLNIRFQNSVED